MRFCSLGSGSGGNATLVETSVGGRVSRVLVDCGFAQRELERRLARTGIAAQELDAIFVTHEHGDHIGCAVSIAQRHGVALWMSRGTWRALAMAEAPAELRFARDGDVIEIGGLTLRPFTVAHDAAEPLQLRFTDGESVFAILTDAGSITPHMVEHLQGCDALLLECNHDTAMLAASAYPASVKARIGGRFGHLSNETSAEVLSACMHSGLRHLVAAHLRRQNNTPALVREALAAAWRGTPEGLLIADPLLGVAWLAIGPAA